jgi:hypothetical protein
MFSAIILHLWRILCHAMEANVKGPRRVDGGCVGYQNSSSTVDLQKVLKDKKMSQQKMREYGKESLEGTSEELRFSTSPLYPCSSSSGTTNSNVHHWMVQLGKALDDVPGFVALFATSHSRRRGILDKRG